MTIYVDALKVYTDRGLFSRGSCHMFTDGDEAELHAFAAKIGMRRAWFQTNPRRREHDHYDLTPKRRERAVALGAVEVTTREAVAIWHRKRDAAIANEWPPFGAKAT